MIYPNYKNLHKKYTLMRKIGEGGMSRVYLAADKKNGNRCAIKIMDTHPDRKEINKKRFLEEIEISKRVNFRNVIKIIDYCYDEKNDEYFMVTEYIDGEILKDIIERNGGLTIDTSVKYATEIAEGLREIHKKGIIHRDLKSTNIMIDNTNSVKIIDFGISITQDSERHTSTNKVIGSVHYFSPEMVQSNNVTPKVDIYALGIIIYEMLIGQTPFANEDVNAAQDIILKHAKEKIVAVNMLDPRIPQSLANIVTKATAKNPKYRYETAKALQYDLESCLNPERALEAPINLKKQKPKKTFLDFLVSKVGIIFFLILSIVTISLIITLSLLSYLGVF